MGLSRPRDWYGMSYEQQREWTRQARQVDYEEARLREDAEAAQMDAHRSRMSARAEICRLNDDFETTQSRYNRLRESATRILREFEPWRRHVDNADSPAGIALADLEKLLEE